MDHRPVLRAGLASAASWLRPSPAPVTAPAGVDAASAMATARAACAAWRPDAPLHVVLNAASGHGDTDERIAALREVMGTQGRAHELLMVRRPAELRRTAQAAVQAALRSGGAVVAAGGDGTINTVAQAVLEGGGVLGVLPQGTFNFFGRAHGIPTEPRPATEQLAAARPQPLQVGLLNGRLFLVNASLGLYPRLLEDREAFKAQYGRRRAVALLAGLVTLMREHGDWELELQAEGEAPRMVRSSTLFVGNNRLQLERVGLDEAPALDEGRLVALRLRPVGSAELLGLLWRGAIGQLGDAPSVDSFAFRRLVVRRIGRRAATVKVALDGEIERMRLPLTFSAAPAALPVLLPPAA
ncbi:diacylglycerol kinase family protein [Aquabacterium sp. J223]|uniref:diacylglycerol/lipid kinase family protein n=1 Tax=Aquabacterium sp. J223 TaxID=2898431 RepID=UPI0021AD8D31|nr:diacylglycerol kinase family protein [Aquabacterium sp. J223]UUX96875.1 diacylglycerol kinase [Aquabacterium sp. J223]